MRLAVCLLFAVLTLAAAQYGGNRKKKSELDELKNVDQDLLFDALKHKEFQDSEDFDEDDKAFMRKISKDDLKDVMKQFSDYTFDESEEGKDEDGEEQDREDDVEAIRSEDEEARKNSADEVLTSNELSMNDEDEITELDKSDFLGDNDEESLEYHNDPLLFGRRRRRRSSRRRRRGSFIRLVKRIVAFLKKHGETIKKGIKWLRKAIHHCCNVTGKCAGRKWCWLGKA